MTFIDLFKTVISDKISQYRNQSQQTNIKFDVLDYANAILNFARNSIYWSRYHYCSNNTTISGKTLSEKHMQFVKMGVYDELYKRVLKMYFSDDICNKLKYQSTDTSFIPNKFCSERTGRNIQYKNKLGIKISSIVDANGVPISLTFGRGSDSDSVLFSETYSQMLLDPETIRYQKSKKFKHNFLMDSGYDTKEIIKLLKDNGYTVFTVKNLRNSKKTNYNIKKLCKKDHSLYNKRIINENSFAWIKQYGILNFVYEKSIKSYRGLLLLILSYITYNKHMNIIAKKQLDENEIQNRLKMEEKKRKQRRTKRHLDKLQREKEKDERKQNRNEKPNSDDIKKTLYETYFGKKTWYIYKG